MKIFRDFVFVVFIVLGMIAFILFTMGLEKRRELEVEKAKANQEEAIKYGEKLGRNMQYFTDSRAKLCFGISQRTSGDFSVTNVPCTEEVLKLVKKGVKY